MIAYASRDYDGVTSLVFTDAENSPGPSVVLGGSRDSLVTVSAGEWSADGSEFTFISNHMGGVDETYVFDLTGERLREGGAIDAGTATSLDGRTAELVGASLLIVQFEVDVPSQQAADLDQINCDGLRWSPTAREVSLTCETPPGGSTVFIVRNLGRGMSDEDHEPWAVPGDSPTWMTSRRNKRGP